ncbi:MAG: sigma-70 family RNA polymerase sigma factor [Lentisphaeraceae bacterium]|nr:sigma-70 family RNA polymerase sigma factor [Lentisphaeraceae bacterium]
MSDYDQTRQTLIERIRDQHNELAWEEFVATYESYIYAIIRRMGISAEDSKDIHQDVVLNLWKKLPDYRKNPNSRFRSWLSTVTSNAVKYFIRSSVNKSKKLDRYENLLKDLDDSSTEIEAIADEEWELFIADKAMKTVEQAFSGRGMDVFQMSLYGHSIAEIAKELNIEENSVYQLRARVKKSLTKEISRLKEELD